MNSESHLFNNNNLDSKNSLINSKNFQNNLNSNNDENSKENINILNSNEIINNLNESHKFINQNYTNRSKLTENEILNYFKLTKSNLEEINKSLLSNVESIDNENIKLKEALTELIKDLKEKENSLDESLRIISKLKDNYSNLFHQYQALEKKYSKLNEENELLRNNYDISNKNKFNIEGINKKNDCLKDELNSIKKDNQLLKNNYLLKNNECIKLIKENNEMKIIIEDFKKRDLEYLNMIKEREDLITQYNNQIKNLNEEINNKNEQMKLLVKFSKNINDENKVNIKELTKQACQTIKLLYSYNNQNNLNNNNNENINNENNKCINCLIKILFNSEDLKDINLNNSDESKNCKIIFKLKEAIQDSLLIDNNENKINISKEFLLDIIIKFNLLKTELYSSFFREFNFVSFLNSLIDKINFKNIKDCNIIENSHKINKIKKQNDFLINQNQELKKKIRLFIDKINELNLYIEKLKKDMNFGKNKIKEKVKIIINLYKNKINFLKDNFNEFQKSYRKENEIYNNGLNKENNYYKNNEDINIQKKNYKHHNKKIRNLHSLKIERNISFYINNYNNNNSLKKKDEKQFFAFSKLNNNIDNNNKIQINTNSINTLSFQQKDPVNKVYSNNTNNNDSFNKMNYHQKRIENEKLKEEIQHLKNEITDLLQEINNQKLINNNNLSINKFDSKNNNNCEKCKNINNLIIKLNIPNKNKLIEIKNIILSSPIFDENIKNIINNIFEIIIKLLTNNLGNYNNKSLKSINMNDKFSLSFENNHFFENLKDYSYFTELNIKIFSSSELKKYYLLYDEKTKDINELIDVYIKRANNIKNNINGIKITYDTSISSNTNEDISLNNIKRNKMEKRKELNIPRIDELDNIKIEDTGYEYKNIHEEIIKLKNDKIIVDNLIELIKNYLIINEKIFQYFLVQNVNIDKYKKYSKKIFKIFKESCCYNMDDISDNNIFHKKLIIKLFEAIFVKS